MDSTDIDDLNAPNIAAWEELKALNEKMSWLVDKMDLVIGELRQISRNTAPRPNLGGTGSSYKR